MSTSAGWYPDPGGQQGMYRYWTGTAWTEAITSTPATTPPPVTPGPGGYPGAGFPGTNSAGAGYPGTNYPGTSYPGTSYPGTSYPGTSYPPTGYPGTGTPQGRRTGTLGWWLAGIAALVAVVIAGSLILRSLGAPIPTPLDPLPGPSATASPNICPPASDSTVAPTVNAEPGWITGGSLAYPALGSPWVAGVDNRVPWGALASMQEVLDQENYDGSGANWVASILVSDLFVGDGFASTKVASETVLKCVLGTYYADTVVTQELIGSQPHDVDGHNGWLIETQLSFSIPGLNATGERVLLLVVQTSDDDYGLFYASVPDTRSELLPDARRAMAGLRVQ